MPAKAAEQGDHHIEKGGLGSGEQFARRFVQGRGEEVEGARENGEADGNGEVAHRVLEGGRVVGAESETITAPMPMMGPISGLINMAPMTTAAESTLRPMEQMTMLKTKIHRLNPRNSMSFLMPAMVCSGSARSMMRNREMARGDHIEQF